MRLLDWAWKLRFVGRVISSRIQKRFGSHDCKFYVLPCLLNSPAANVTCNERFSHSIYSVDDVKFHISSTIHCAFPEITAGAEFREWSCPVYTPKSLKNIR